MAEDKLSLHVDSDWKKQAQEEKRKLAEQAQKAPAAPIVGAAGAAAVAAPPGAPGGAAPAASSRAGRLRREVPEPGFPALVQSINTQILYYLGELPTQGGEAGINLDMAKYHLDMLGMLEAKTANNLAPEEKLMLDAAVYEMRMRFIGLASQFTGVD